MFGYTLQSLLELRTSENLLLILSLAILECILSVDNALVLSIMVGHLPEKQQKKALTYGLMGAYLFRLILIPIGAILLKIVWIKVISAIYLMYLTFEYFKSKNESGETVNKNIGKSLLMTIISVELMDLTFSIDSIATALALSKNEWIVLFGAMIGILGMRFISSLFVKLIKKFPELESGAYILILVVGIKLMLTVFEIEMPNNIFLSLMGIIFGGTFLVSVYKNKTRGDLV